MYACQILPVGAPDFTVQFFSPQSAHAALEGLGFRHDRAESQLAARIAGHPVLYYAAPNGAVACVRDSHYAEQERADIRRGQLATLPTVEQVRAHFTR